MNIKTTKDNGKHFGTVFVGDRIAFQTPGYYTEGMALAAAECWIAFHGKDAMPVYILAKESELYGRQPLGRVVNGKHTPTEYTTKEAAWESVKECHMTTPVTVLADGEPVATFQWLFKTPDEPVPGKPNKVRQVRDLCKWTRGGWKETGVQAVGVGRERFIRTVAA
ncbi:hypothetical protein [Streptomyces sp. R08]|uniref:Uncharacterized protein n=1 Tax=Streptomyces sp. R08 TaxID=3238624 RepID=A0AB39MB44_9ACTN